MINRMLCVVLLILVNNGDRTWLVAQVTAVPSKSAPREIDAYLARPEPDFAWQTVSEDKVNDTRVLRIELTSQRWQGIVWKHSLMVYEPQQLVHPNHMLLFITGGNNGNAPSDAELAMGVSMATMCGARIAVLHQVPNQPLMDGRTEDDLITETWLKYLETGDASWPLLFPMVKSAVKALDALEQIAAKQGWGRPQGFVVAGVSKRGWTSWLTAAAEPRIIGTAPMVIDMLNFSVQMKHQIEMWGAPSEQIHDYTSKGLISENGEPRAGRETQLWQMMDPFQYRDRLKLPKLLIVGANDRYWTTDAMNQYWDDLQGDKYIHRVPNGGHGLEGGRDGALATLGVFFRHTVSGAKLPLMSWTASLGDKEISIVTNCETKPIQAKLWVAESESMDFRDSRWQSQDMIADGNSFRGAVQPKKHQAIFAELLFESEGIPYSLSTLAYCR